MPMTEPAWQALSERFAETPGSEHLFPSPSSRASKLYIGSIKRVWQSTLRWAEMPYFSLYELRHTFATRLSAGGVADHFVTQMLRQGDAHVFKRYSPAKLNVMREALSKLDRQANERPGTFSTARPN